MNERPRLLIWLDVFVAFTLRIEEQHYALSVTLAVGQAQAKPVRAATCTRCGPEPGAIRDVSRLIEVSRCDFDRIHTILGTRSRPFKGEQS